MNVVLISTYELGRQPFGLASPAAWLRSAGANVTCLDLFSQRLDAGSAAIAAADLVAFHLPMHTATRIAAAAAPRVRSLNPRAHLCFYGLYAPLNAGYLRRLGADSILGGEFEQGLLDIYQHLLAGNTKPTPPEPLILLERLAFQKPDRSGLPALERYARLEQPGAAPVIAGYTETSRGCKHLCRHCPIVPVYGGRFRVVQPDVVLADIAQQVEAGAGHITFGDPDFFNGPTHALRIVRALHARFPGLTYDVTIKIEHLLAHARYLPTLRDTGCVLVTSAVEAVDDGILEKFAKRHTRADFIRAVELLRGYGLALQPTFVAFNPWISLEGYCDLLALLAELDLIEHVPSVQLAIRLLIPAGSRLLELPEVQHLIGPFDETALCFPWAHPDPRVDALQAQILATVKAGAERDQSRRTVFAAIWELAQQAAGQELRLAASRYALADKPIPFLSEPWYC